MSPRSAAPPPQASTLLWTAQRAYGKDCSAPAHGFVEIVVTVRGQARHRIQGEERSLARGDAFLLPPGICHTTRDARALVLRHCGFHPRLLDRELAWMRTDPTLAPLLPDRSGGPRHAPPTLLHLSEPELQTAVQHLCELAELQDRGLLGHRADVVGRLALLLGVLGRARDDCGATQPAGVTHPAVADALHILNTQAEREWTLTDLADVLSLTPSYLSRLFKGHTGLPPMAYLARRRAESAADLLAHTDAAISDIAESVGWSDQNYFARRFKAHFGMSPSEYRHSTRPSLAVRAAGHARHGAAN